MQFETGVCVWGGGGGVESERERESVFITA